jgi:hypothetical protein
MNRPQQISLVVTSHTATLAQLAPALGESALKHHAVGTHRANGLIRQQSVWFGHWSADAGEIEDLLEKVLEWLSERKSAVIAVDPSAYLKIVCTPADGGLVVAPSTAAKLAELGVLLLVEGTGPAVGEA